MTLHRMSRVGLAGTWRLNRIFLEGARKKAIETGRKRLMVTGIAFALAFAVIGARTVEVSIIDQTHEPRLGGFPEIPASTMKRADIVDRNGMVLATNLPAASLYADPTEILDPQKAAKKLSLTLPYLDQSWLYSRLTSKGRFSWLARNITPEEQYEINRLGLPGVYFKTTETRVYPHGRSAAHLLGFTDTDGRGIAGVENYFDEILEKGGQPLVLSVDIRLQGMLQEELGAAVRTFQALGGAGLIMDVRTSEVLAMASLPDFDPNRHSSLEGRRGFNRVTKGVYELGSTFKLFNTAIALDTGTVSLDSAYDASTPLRYARFTINDFHPKNRWLSIAEILSYSSNIGSAKMAMDYGTLVQRDYLGRLGLLRPAQVELPEIGRPLSPSPWREINTLTISYGHGIAVSPLQFSTGVVTLVNGGVLRPATVLKADPEQPVQGSRVFSEKTSRIMRDLMRRVVLKGTGRNAAAPGYRVGGKTGSAEKSTGSGYAEKALISSFVGAFPMDDPRYVILVMLDEPRGNEATYNYATAGWVAAPAVKRLVERMALLLGVVPDFDALPPSMASLKRAPASPGGYNLAAH